MVLKIIRTLNDLLDLIEDHGAVIFMAVLMIILAIQVISRPLGLSVPWTEEAARLAFIWTVFLALPLAAKRGQLIYIKTLTRLWPHGLQVIVNLGEKIIWLLVCLLWTWFSARNIIQLGTFTPKTPLLGLSHTVIFAVMPLAFLLTARQAAKNILAALVRKNTPS